MKSKKRIGTRIKKELRIRLCQNEKKYITRSTWLLYMICIGKWESNTRLE